jgi:sugar O-acyltransferase (sialic acid O-acetyltransferase NeuD family)
MTIPPTTLILGAGGHGQVVADILIARRRAANTTERGPDNLAFLDDNSTLIGHKFLGVEVVGTLAHLSDRPADSIIVAIGDNATRARVCHQLLQASRELISAVHPSAVLGSEVRIGAGVMICACAVVNTGTTVGDGVILNTGCCVDHHGSIGAYAHVAPGVHLGGNVTVGEGALIGLGASVVPGVRIGARAVVGAGAVVIEDVADDDTVVGVPARPRSQPDRAARESSSSNRGA